MKTLTPTRETLPASATRGPAYLRLALSCSLIALASPLPAQQHAPGRPNILPIQQHPAPHPANGPNHPANNPSGPRNQEHLSEWMSRHRDLPVPAQQRALEGEPGFHELPAQTQQRMRDRLSQLNSMPPQQRNRILERNEAMEHLQPNQRQQVRGAMLQLGAIPEDRRRAVARAFRDLREMPEAQRQQFLNSPAYRAQYSDQERATLGNLMAVEPYLPGRHTAEAPPQ